MTNNEKRINKDTKAPGILLKEADAAHYLGIGIRRLAKLRVSGAGPSSIKLGRFFYYSHHALDVWVHERDHTCQQFEPGCQRKQIEEYLDLPSYEDGETLADRRSVVITCGEQPDGRLCLAIEFEDGGCISIHGATLHRDDKHLVGNGSITIEANYNMGR